MFWFNGLWLRRRRRRRRHIHIHTMINELYTFNTPLTTGLVIQKDSLGRIALLRSLLHHEAS
jgi:hypothetical protein